MRRPFILLVALLGLLPLPLVTAAPASAQTDPATVEQQFVARVNDLRATKGLTPLAVYPELTAVARRWAAKMAEADAISHNPNLTAEVTADWQKLGENVGVGMEVQGLHDAFVRSPAHYRNLVDPDFTYIGVGVVFGRDGAIFTAHQFMRLRSSTPAATPAPTSSPRAAKPARPVPTPPVVEASPVPAVVTVAAPPARLVLVLQQLRLLDGR